MSGWLRRLRGMCGLGALWGALWAPIGVAMTLVQLMLVGYGWPSWSLLGFLLLDGVRNGFIAGFLFAGGLGVAFRDKSFADLRTGAIAAVGALAGVVLPAGSMAGMAAAGYFVPAPITVALTLLFGAGMGAATAVGSLKIAQAAPDRVAPGDPSAGLLE